MIHAVTVALFVLPLCLDTFALSAGLGAAGLPPRERLRASLILATFEAVMPLVGFVIGSGIGTVLGRVSEYLAATMLAGIGIFMVWPRDEEDEAESVLMLRSARGAAIIGLGLGISLDELAIGFGGGLLRLPLPFLAVLIGAQAYVAAQIGMRVGQRVGEAARERAEQLAGVMLIGVGVLILVERQIGL